MGPGVDFCLVTNGVLPPSKSQGESPGLTVDSLTLYDPLAVLKMALPRTVVICDSIASPWIRAVAFEYGIAYSLCCYWL